MILALIASGVVMARLPLVCLDPGHPSEVGPGTRGIKITELEAVWEIALAAKPLLEEQGVRVILTRESVNQMVLNRDRAQVANASGAHLMVRLHMDAAKERGWGTYHPHQQGTVQGVTGPSPWVIEKSTLAAKAFHKGVFAVLLDKHPDRGVMDESKTAVGARQGALTGSIFSEVPVVLVEMATLTLREDEVTVASLSGRSLLTKGLVEGTLSALKALGRTLPHQGIPR